ncbi:hypothetical protein HY29_12215 [Hyphomonas beringensis]|uniref:Cytochrome C oxidase assembly protein n=1 Tax=Hyphomonas beringensis TaxID=1280946 RepID=A0A062U563_9PROT|nr:hypothetical protein [Hyphomonas beringensis]KCZ55481.1 hypothetical protein HY29_12215 [Hyphomonas beringensis]
MTEPENKYEGQFKEIYIPSAEEQRARRSRNRVLGFALAGFVILVGVVTFIRLSSSDLSKSGFYYNFKDKAAEEEMQLPPGMEPDQAAPPPNLTPVEPEQDEPTGDDL